ncbi:hypothetical protein ABIA30_005349 [Mycobacterium sp. MAA66]|uniref:DUF5994 family protein n=1 Tax=Mycobacterium sp. MAA66 TaxID=3156297 RepID=UPI0035175658
MTLQAHNVAKRRRTRTPPEHTPRLRLKPKAPHSGYVDGAWWPRSDDLATELPDLLAVLSVRLGTIDRVMYNLAEWVKAPAKLATGGRQVRLDGYRRQPAKTLEVRGLNRERILLLVVPVQTDADQSHATMMAASAVNGSTVADLLTARPQDGRVCTQTTAAQALWDSEGGAQRSNAGGRTAACGDRSRSN